MTYFEKFICTGKYLRKDQIMSLGTTASNLLKRGVEMDGKKRYTESLICYQEGIQLLVDMLKGSLDETKLCYIFTYFICYNF